MAVPSSAELHAAGLVAGVAFVAEFWTAGRWFLAVPTGFFHPGRALDSPVRCAFTGRDTTYGRLVKRLATRECTAVATPRPIALHPATLQTALWVKTSARLLR